MRRLLTCFPLIIFAAAIVSSGLSPSAYALPAFALREHVSCIMCHMNGSAPHLNEFGYLYRRAGFRMPNKIGDKDNDDQAMSFLDHMAAGVNIDYEWADQKPSGATSTTMTSNQVNVPEVEVWPLVGGFLGNFGVWSEIDAVPATSGPDGGVSLSQADLRYVYGTQDLFFNFRGGMIAPEGFGASDQWLDDANIPVFDQLTAFYNENTLALPVGAMETPQLGVEFGINVSETHGTLGIYNGFSGLSGSAVPALMRESAGLSKDVKLQVDQFVSDLGAVTAVYYSGAIPLRDPTGTAFSWTDHYQQGRLYLTAFAIPSKLDVLLGGALARNQFVTASPTPDGTFQSRGAFIGFNYYVMPHLTLSARTDFHQFNTTPDQPARAGAYSLQASLPFDYNLFVFHFDSISSDVAADPAIAGTSRDFRAEWRFLF